MLSYCLKCRKNTESKNSKVEKKKKKKKKKTNEKPMLLSNYSVWKSKTSKFFKQQEAKGLLSMIGKILLIGSLLMQ